MKKIFCKLMVLVALLLPFDTANAAYFDDIPDSHKNAEAINYLKENEIINGYTDNTFKPDKKVNRAEFLKIIIEGSGINPSSETPTGFLDVVENAWYAKYIREAKAQGWVDGYTDNTFKPQTTINKAEALKIIGEIQNWGISSKLNQAPFKDVPKLSWYAKYVDFAKEHELLEVQGTYFQPGVIMSRAKVSEIIYRTIMSSDEINEVDESEEIPENNDTPDPPDQEEENLDFTPIKAEIVDKDFFDKISLDEDFPNTFYKNEIYTFKGEITQGTYQDVFVFLNANNENLSFQNQTDGNTFEIKVHLKETGNFKLGIIPGSQGTSKVVEVSILPSLPTAIELQSTANKPNSLSASFENDQTTFEWSNISDITKLKIYQGSKIKNYIFRQETTSFSPEYKDFEGFSEGDAKFKVSTATVSGISPLQITSDWKSSTIKNIEITQHLFSDINEEKISYSTIPKTLEIPQKIQFAGKTKDVILRKAAVITPDGTVDEVNLSATSYGDYFGNDTIQKGHTYTFQYTPKKKGTYIIEINEDEGYAAINTPVYIGDKIPLIPDFLDLEGAFLLSKTPINIGDSKDEILSLINETRKAMDLNELEASDELDDLAQRHTNDMIQNNFFGHINLQGETPDDRRKTLEIATSVGENLAKAGSIPQAHNGLLRSAIHRANIINDDWKRVGIGVQKDANGYYVISQEFSGNPLTEDDLNGLETEIINSINIQRATSLINDSTLNDISAQWTEVMVDQEFLGFTAPGGEGLEDLISENSTNKQIQGFVVEGSTIEGIIQKIEDDTEITDSIWKNLGLSLKISKTGMLKLTLLYTT